MKYIFNLFITLIVFALFFSSVCFAGTAFDRIKNRIQQISKMKTNGQVVEKEDGFLQATSSDSRVVKLVEEENADRKEVYILIANKKGVTPELVGKRRAIMIRKKEAISSGKPLKSVPSRVSRIIIKKCTEKWPDNFRMQKYCRDEEAKAWLEMN